MLTSCKGLERRSGEEQAYLGFESHGKAKRTWTIIHASMDILGRCGPTGGQLGGVGCSFSHAYFAFWAVA
jgi:hypothetical protein